MYPAKSAMATWNYCFTLRATSVWGLIGLTAILGLSLGFTQSAFAATDTWGSGSVTSLFSTGTWVGGNTPPVTGDALVFDTPGAGGVSLTDDLASLSIAGITFTSNATNGSSGYTITAAATGTNTIVMTGNILNNGPSGAANAQILALDIINSASFSVGGTGNTTLQRVAMANSATNNLLTYNGAGVLTLGGTGTSVNSDNNMALDVESGEVDLAMSGSLIAIDRGLTVNNSALLKYTGSSSNMISDGQSVNLNGTSTLDFNSHSDSIGALNGTGTVTNNSASSTSTITIGVNNGTAPVTGSFSGNITNGASGSGIVALVKNGDGIETLSGNDNYTGGTTISRGVLALGSATALGTGSGTLTIGTGTTGGTAQTQVQGGIDNTLGSTITLTNPLSLTNSFAFLGTSGDLVLTNNSAGAVSTSLSKTITINGAGRTLNISAGLASTDTAATTLYLNAPGSGTITNSTNVTANATPVVMTYTKGNTLSLGSLGLPTAALTILGTSNVTVPGAVSGTSASALVWADAGTLTMGGTNTYGSTTTLDGGSVVLDYSTNNTSKLSDTAALIFNGGVNLTLSGGSHTEVVSATTLNTGGALNLALANGSTAKLQLGAITHSTGSALNVAASSATTNTLNSGTTGIIGGWATVGGTDWATSGTSGTNLTITALPAGSYTALNTTGGTSDTNNSIQTGSATIGGSSVTTVTNSLKITTSGAGQSLAIGTGNTLTLTNGGLLFTGANDYSITGGTLKSATSATTPDLIINQWGTGKLTISSVIANGGTGAQTLTKTGTGTLVLANPIASGTAGGNSFTGNTFITEGTLALGADNQLPQSANVFMSGSNSTFDLAGHAQTIGQLGAANATNNSAGDPVAVGSTITSSVAGGMLTINNGGNNDFVPRNMTFTGQLKLVLTGNNYGSSTNGSSSVNAVQLANQNDFSGGLLVQGTGSLVAMSTANFQSGGGITFSNAAAVRANNGGDPLGTGSIQLDGGELWIAGASVFFNINNPISITGRGGILRNESNNTLISSAITSTSSSAFLAFENQGNNATDTNLTGDLSGFHGTFAIDTTQFRNLNLSGPNTANMDASLVFGGNGAGGTVQWNGATTATTVAFAEVTNGVNGGSTTVGKLSSGVSTTVTYQLGDNTSNTPTFGGVIQNGSGTVGVTKVDSDTQILTGVNTYTGNTTVSGGTLQIGTATITGASLANTNITVGTIGGAAGSLPALVSYGTLNSAATPTATITVNSGSLTANGQVNGGLITVNGGTATFNSTVSNSAISVGVAAAGGTAIISSTGNWTPTGGATAVGTVNSGGTLQVIGNVNAPASIAVNAGGTLSGGQTFGTTIGANSGTGTGVVIAAQGILNMAGDNQITTFNLNNASGLNSLSIGGATGTDKSILDFDLGATGTDKVALGTGSKFLVNTGGGTINITGIPGFGAGTFQLLTYDNGAVTGTGGLAAITLGTTPGGLFTYALSKLSTEIDLVVSGNPTPSIAYWKGGQATNNWNAFSGSTTNWSPNPDGSGDTSQLPGGSTDVHFSATSFGTGPLTTTLGQDFGVNSLNFDSGSSVIINGSNKLLINNGINVSTSGTVTISNNEVALQNSQTWTNNGGLLTVSATVTGGSSNQLSTSGSGVIFLSNANSYSGGTSINSGTLKVGNPSSVGSGAVSDGGTLDLNGVNLGISKLNGSGIVTNSNSSTTGILNFNGTATDGVFSGSIQNGAGVVAVAQTGSGVTTLSPSSNNTYIGGTTMAAGTLNINKDTALGAVSSAVTFTGNSTIQAGGSGVTLSSSRVINVNNGVQAKFDPNGNNDMVVNSLIQNSTTGGIVSITGSNGGSVTLGHANTYGGGTNVATNLTLLAGNNTAFGAGSVTVASGGTLDLNGHSIGNSISLAGDGVNSFGVLQNNSATAASLTSPLFMASTSLTIGGSGNITLNGLTNPNGQTWTYAGAGTLTLTGSNSYLFGLNNGIINVNSGTMVLGFASSATINRVCDQVNINGGAILKFDPTLGTVTAGGSWGGQVNNIIELNAGGILDLNGSTGQNTRIQQLVTVDNGATGGTITNSSPNPATLSIEARRDQNLTFPGLIQDGNGPVSLVFEDSLNTAGGANNFLTLTGNNTYSGGTTITGSVLEITQDSALGKTTGAVTFAAPIAAGNSNGGIVLMVSSSAIPDGNGNIVLDPARNVIINSGVTGTLNNNGFNFVIGGVISGAGNLTSNGGGYTILSNANTYSGTTSVLNGTLQLNNLLALQNSTLNVPTAATVVFKDGIGGNTTGFTLGGLSGSGNLTLNDLAAGPITVSVGNNSGNTTYSGSLSDGSTGSSLTKIGTGNLILNGNSTYSGKTKITRGTLTLGSGTGQTIATTSRLELAGGTLAVGGGTSQLLVNTPLLVSSSSIINMGGVAGSSVQFNDSNTQTWAAANPGMLLRINGWTLGNEHILFPHSTSLSSSQLPEIHFTDILGTAQLVSSSGLFELEPTTTTPLLLGDVNDDHHVDALDIIALEKLLTNIPAYEAPAGNPFGMQLNNADLLDIADINDDQTVSSADIQALIKLLQGGHGSSTPAVPEPTSAVLLALGGIAFVCFRPRLSQAGSSKGQTFVRSKSAV